jgi:hypothetical protein
MKVNMRTCIFVVLLLAAMCGYASPAQATIPKDILFTSESTNRNFAEISSASEVPMNGTMPVMYMTLTAGVYIGADPFPNQQVTFSTNHPEWIELNTTSGTTDAWGLCRVIIHGKGTAADMDVARVDAKWTDNLSIQHTASVNITLRGYNTTFATTPLNGPTFSPATNIPYRFHELNLTSSYAANSISTFTFPGEITWSQVASGEQVRFEEYWASSDSRFAYKIVLGPSYGNKTLIRYNLAQLHGFHSEWSFDVTTPIGWRHHVQETSNHELAHALGIGHNTTFLKSLMTLDEHCYFVWGTTLPRDDSELDPLHALYPGP